MKQLCPMVFVLVAGPWLSAADAIRHDGTTLRGTLTLTPQGTFAFQHGEQAEPIDNLEFVRFPAQPARFGQALRLYRMTLNPQESFTAELLRLDDTHLHVRTLWTDSLAVPRTAIERVVPLEQPVLYEPFTNELTAWKVTGQPTREAGQLRFTQRGQQIEHRLTKPLTNGKLALRASIKTMPMRRGRVECDFGREGKTQTLAIELSGPDPNITVTGGSPDFAPKVARNNQTRFAIEFGADGTHLFADDAVVWSSRQGLGALQAFRVLSDGAGDEVFVCSEILLSAPVKPIRPWADLTRDAMRTTRGDEVYGTFQLVQPPGLTIRNKAQTTLIRWQELHEFTFQRGEIPSRSTQGEHGTVRWRSIDQERDSLSGAITALDAKTLTLKHAVLGSIRLPMPQVEELRLLFHGQTVLADTTPHHLGTRLAFGFAQPKPVGTRWTKSVTIDQPPASGFMVIDAAHVAKQGTPIELFLNNERLDTLNRHADQRTATVQRFRFPIPVKAWRRGENMLEIRLALNADLTPTTGVDLRAVRLEIHQPR